MSTAGPKENTQLRQQIQGQRRDLAEVLAGLSEQQWQAPSLCAGWRIREVVAHLTMPLRYSTPRFLAELARSRGRFDEMADRRARRDAQAPTAELLAQLSDNIDHPWRPPGGAAGALCHDVIHGLDITVALGLDRRVPLDRVQVVLDAIATPKRIASFGTDLTGLRLVADDLDFTTGTGQPVTGAAQNLILALCGRRLPAGLLTGSGAERFS